MTSRSLSDFPGGLWLAGHKELSNGVPARAAPVPSRLVLPLKQHIGTPSQSLVNVGELVAKGQLIAQAGSYVSVAMHAPTSGRIVEIAPHPTVHPVALAVQSIVIEPDGKDDEIDALEPMSDWRAQPIESIHARLRDAGIVGMGGAGFPGHVKVTEGAAHDVSVLIINGVECEPYITCDDRLLRERPKEVLEGAAIIAHAVQAAACVVAVEEDMPDAYAALCAAPGDVEVVRVPAKYPAGGEKQLIKTLTGLEVPSGGLPIQVGVMVHNVATAAAVYRAVVSGRPLLSRLVTVTGEVAEPGNYEVLIGTPVDELLAGFGIDARKHSLIAGGPMMGIELIDWRVPISKTTNCILVQQNRERAREGACIRCDRCAEVCPIKLQPQSLFEFARHSDFDAIQDYHLFDCIECGCCAHVCPSSIPLLHYYRHAKSEIQTLDHERARARAARSHYIAREARLADAVALGAVARTVEADEQAKENSVAIKEYINAAVQRSRTRRSKRPGAGVSQSDQ